MDTESLSRPEDEYSQHSERSIDDEINNIETEIEALSSQKSEGRIEKLLALMNKSQLLRKQKLKQLKEEKGRVNLRVKEAKENTKIAEQKMNQEMKKLGIDMDKFGKFGE